MTQFIRQLRLLLLGLWLGAAIFFGASVAATLFNGLHGTGLSNSVELANRKELAGAIVARLLAEINRGGFEIALFLFVTAFFVNRSRTRLAQLVEVISIAIMAIMTAGNHWIISARMQALHASMGMIDQVAPNDARRVEFDSLHRYSVMVMAVALVAGLVVFFIASRSNTESKRERSPDR